MIDEKELLLDISRGDSVAYDRLYMQYSAMVRRFVFKLTGSESESEDITHDVFLNIWINRSKVIDIRSVKSYLFRSTTNAVYDLMRKKNSETKYRKAVDFLCEDEIDSSIDARDLEVLINIAIEKMPKERKTIFLMSRHENLSYKEIASKLGISQDTVKYHITNALAEIRKIITIVIIFTQF